MILIYFLNCSFSSLLYQTCHLRVVGQVPKRSYLIKPWQQSDILDTGEQSSGGNLERTTRRALLTPGTSLIGLSRVSLLFSFCLLEAGESLLGVSVLRRENCQQERLYRPWLSSYQWDRTFCCPQISAYYSPVKPHQKYTLLNTTPTHLLTSRKCWL